MDPLRQFSVWEIILYTMTFSFFIEEAVKIGKVGRARWPLGIGGAPECWAVVRRCGALLTVDSAYLEQHLGSDRKC